MIEFEDLDEYSAEDSARAALDGQTRRTPSAGPPVTVPRNWLVLALIGAAVLGLLVGRWSTSSGSSGSTVTSTGTPAPDPPNVTVGPLVGQFSQASSCATQSGKQLQVGIQVLNQSGQPAALSLIRIDLPLSGFTVVQAGFGACSEMANDGRDQIAVPPGGAVWVSALLRPTVRCITPLPVRFRADVQTGQETTTQTLGGFSDLGNVKWSGCPAQSSQFS